MNTNRTPLFYMANLGSELTRALLEYYGRDYEKMENSVARARDILAKIEVFPEMKSRHEELKILESVIENLGNKKFELDKKQFLDYFSPFAARLISS